jgi:hypothetical protein
MRKVVLTFLILALVSPCLAKYSGGSGTASDPYQIATAADLNDIGNHTEDFSNCFLMTADINMAGISRTEYRIIGSESTPFSGVFDGNQHTISNLNAGLFDYASSPSAVIIKNVGLVDVNVLGSTALVRYFFNGEISGCYAKGGTAGGFIGSCYGNISHCYTTCNILGSEASGIVGFYEGGEISYCYSTGNITATGTNCGGIVGENWGGYIYRCYSTGNINSSGPHTGGIVGAHQGTIEECWSTSNVTDTGPSGATGGLVGASDAWMGPANIINCYARGIVTGPNTAGGGEWDGYVGGLVGVNSAFGGDATIKNCYSSGLVSGLAGRTGGLAGLSSGGDGTAYYTGSLWDVNTSGQATSAGGTGKTTAEMQTQSTFADANWNLFLWIMQEGVDYPQLAWAAQDSPNGTAENPYLIYNVWYLRSLGANTDIYDKHFRLTADINMAGYIYTSAVIAPDTNGPIDGFQGTPFTGTFNGAGHCISNLTIKFDNFSFNNYLGFFGRLGSGAQITKLGLVDVNIQSNSRSRSFAGALAAENRGGIVNQCYSTGLVKASDWHGGLIGHNYSGTISNCYSHCSVRFFPPFSFYSGGIAGDNSTTDAVIINCYSTGKVSGVSGGLIGENYGSVIASFWDVNTSGQTTSAGGTGKTTTQMQTQSTFTDSGWDFVWETANGPNDIWAICEGVSYPKLAWQFIAGDSDNDKDVDFADFAPLANKWMQADSNLYCGGADLTGDGWVDLADLGELANNWLKGF